MRDVQENALKAGPGKQDDLMDAIWRQAAETFAPHIIRRSAGAHTSIRPIAPLVLSATKGRLSPCLCDR